MTKYTDMSLNLTALIMPMSSAENLCKQFGLIRPDKMLGPIWIKTVRHSGSIPEFFFGKS